jgi:uncharacterized membrane protein (UPF0127 family)
VRHFVKPPTAREVARFLAAVALCSVLNSCKEESPVSEWVQLPAKLKVEIAQTPEQRQKGLMFRQNLPDGEGMYFVFEKEDWLSFYMKDTRIPLTIAYITKDAVIESIKDLTPLDEQPVYSSSPAQFALEAKRGWFEENNIRPGDRVVLKEGQVSFLRRTGPAIGEE